MHAEVRGFDGGAEGLGLGVLDVLIYSWDCMNGRSGYEDHGRDSFYP